MRILHDSYMVTIDQEFEVVRMKSGLDSLNAAYFEEEQESKYKFRRQWGTVINVPAVFTDDKDHPFDIIDTGIPQCRKFIPSELIQAMANQGYTKLPVYWPSTFDEFETITLADIGAKMGVKKGDKIYFDYQISDKENFLGMHNGAKMYKVNVDQIYCSVRRERSKIDRRYRDVIYMQGGWVLVKPDVESWEEIKTATGLLRKPKPEAKALQGFVQHIRPGIDMKPGDHIVYIRHADYMVQIEGTMYYVMREDDILCRVW
jgi:co-chaperonin GroES (HSP10)